MAAWRRLTAATSSGTSQSALRPMIARSELIANFVPGASPVTSSKNAIVRRPYEKGIE
jgi:hypothetical protein